ncbi:MAG: hypothetical protein RIS34_2007 [Pseudomonadota bacterium]|jgi:hypothetical protein
MTMAFRFVTAALLTGQMCLLSPALAATHLLDDSASHVMPPNVQMAWHSPAPGRAADHDVETRVTVNVRIDTRAWVGRIGRIYMVLPQDSGPPMMAQWQTQGRLLPGRLVSGERGLVYSGLITQATLDDQIQVHLRTDGRWTSNSRRLNFHFELDTD